MPESDPRAVRVERAGDEVFRLAGGVTVEEARAWLRAEAVLVMHRSRRTSVEKIAGRDGFLCRKTYFLDTVRRKVTHAIFRPARTSFDAHLRLLSLGISTARPLCGYERTQLGVPQEAALVTTWVEGRQFHLYGQDAFAGALGGARFQEKKRFLDAHASFVARFQAAGLRHKDLAAQNTLVRETQSGWEFCLLDLDTVTFGKVSERLASRNLVHCLDLPPFTTRTDILRWIRAYLSAGGQGIVAAGERAILGRVLAGLARRAREKERRRRRLEREGRMPPRDADTGGER